MKKRIVCFLLAVMMIAALIPFSAFPALAEDAPEAVQESACLSETISFNNEREAESEHFTLTCDWMNEDGWPGGSEGDSITITPKNNAKLFIRNIEAVVGYYGSYYVYVGVSSGTKREGGNVEDGTTVHIDHVDAYSFSFDGGEDYAQFKDITVFYQIHTHTPTTIPQTEATATEHGISTTHYYCEGCGLYFADAECEHKITKETAESYFIHRWSDGWIGCNERGHIHSCTYAGCSATTILAHSGYIEDGVCDACGYSGVFAQTIRFVYDGNEENVTAESEHFLLTADWQDEGGWYGGYEWCSVTITPKNNANLFIRNIEAEVSYYGSYYADVGVSSGTKREIGNVRNGTTVHIDDVDAYSFSFDGGDDCSQFKDITVFYQVHTHAPITIPQTEATATEHGISTTHYYCEGCGLYFADAECEHKITKETAESYIIHRWSDGWIGCNERGHIHSCTYAGCSATTILAHTGYIKDGVCDACGHSGLFAETIRFIYDENEDSVTAESEHFLLTANYRDKNGWRGGSRWNSISITAKSRENLFIRNIEAVVNYYGEDYALVGVSGGTKRETENVKNGTTVHIDHVDADSFSFAGGSDYVLFKDITVFYEVHIHTPTLFSAKPATLTEHGISKTYYYCEGCGKYFSDEDCENRISEETVEGYIIHNWREGWSQGDYNGHIRPCTCTGCDAKLTEAHTGYSEDGVCDVCGYAGVYAETFVCNDQETAETEHFILTADGFFSGGWFGGTTGDELTVSPKIEGKLQIRRIEAVVKSYGNIYSKVGVSSGKKVEEGNVENGTRVHIDNVDALSFAFTGGSDWAAFSEVTVFFDLHTHTPTLVSAKPATLTEHGISTAYYKCDVCGKCFADEQCKNEITEAMMDAYIAHHPSEITAKSATLTEHGISTAYYKCDVCGKCFADEPCKNELAQATVDGYILHNWTQWSQGDAKGHTRTCTVCDAKETHPHTGYIEDGVCDVCGYSGIFAETIVFNNQKTAQSDHFTLTADYFSAYGWHGGTGASKLAVSPKTEGKLQIRRIEAVVEKYGNIYSKVGVSDGKKVEEGNVADGTRVHIDNLCAPSFAFTGGSDWATFTEVTVFFECHTHTPTLVSAKPETLTEHGISTAYYKCDACGKYFADEQCKNELTQATVDGYILHNWTQWSQGDAKGHTHTCTVCGENETLSHSGYIEDGVCDVCGYSGIFAETFVYDNQKTAQSDHFTLTADYCDAYGWHGGTGASKLTVSPKTEGKFLISRVEAVVAKLGNFYSKVGVSDGKKVEEGNVADGTIVHIENVDKPSFAFTGGSSSVIFTEVTVFFEGHTHTPTPISAKSATLTEHGISTAYFKCDACGKYFADEQCKNELTQATVDGYILHNWTQWSQGDAKGHTHTCTVCGAKETHSHSGYIEDGVCDVCGYSGIFAETFVYDNQKTAQSDHFTLTADYFDAYGWYGGTGANKLTVSPKTDGKLLILRVEAVAAKLGDFYSKVGVSGGKKAETGNVADGTIVHIDNVDALSFAFTGGSSSVIFTEVTVFFEGHTHTPTPVFAKSATLTEHGISTAYFKCDVCGKYFADEQCKNELTQATVDGYILHNWTQWSQGDAKGHIHTCTVCGENETLSHSGYIEDGVCDVCGYSGIFAETFVYDNQKTAQSDHFTLTADYFDAYGWHGGTGANKLTVSPKIDGKLLILRVEAVAAKLGDFYGKVGVSGGKKAETGNVADGTIVHIDNVDALSFAFTGGSSSVIFTEVTVFFEGHTHTPTPVSAKSATLTEHGISTAYFKCDVCGKYFADEQCKNELTQATVDGYILHNWTQWSQGDAKGHIHTCTVCGENETLSHSGYIEDGVCDVCGYSGIFAETFVYDNQKTAQSDHFTLTADYCDAYGWYGGTGANKLTVSPKTDGKLLILSVEALVAKLGDFYGKVGVSGGKKAETGNVADGTIVHIDNVDALSFAFTGGSSSVIFTEVTVFFEVHEHTPTVSYTWNGAHNKCTATKHCTVCEKVLLTEESTDITLVEIEKATDPLQLDRVTVSVVFETIGTVELVYDGDFAPDKKIAHITVEGDGGVVALKNSTPVANASYIDLEDTDTLTLTAVGKGFRFWKNNKNGAILTADPVLAVPGIRDWDLVAVFAEAADTSVCTVYFKDSKTGRILKTLEVAPGTVLTASDLPDASFKGYKLAGWKLGDGDAVGYTVKATCVATAVYVRDTAVRGVVTVRRDGMTSTTHRAYGEVVAVTAKGKDFSYWTLDGKVISLDRCLCFSAPGRDCTLTAVYGAEDAPEALAATVDLSLKENSIYFTVSRSVPADAKIVETGVLMTRKATADDLTVNTALDTVTRGYSTAKDADNIVGFVKDVTGKPGTWLVRGYVTYTLAGVTATVYTAVGSVTV